MVSLSKQDLYPPSFYTSETENEKEIHTRFQAARLFALNEGLSDTLSVLSTITVIFVAAYLVLVGKITMGTLLALVQLSSSFMAPVILIMQNIPKIRSMKAVIARLNQYSANEAHGETRQNIPTFDRTIEFQDLSFSYDGNGTLLSSITFQIEKGKKYAEWDAERKGTSWKAKLKALIDATIPKAKDGSMSILWTKKVERLCCFFEFLILLLLWCQITDRAMDPFTVIPALYVFKDCSASFP